MAIFNYQTTLPFSPFVDDEDDDIKNTEKCQEYEDILANICDILQPDLQNYLLEYNTEIYQKKETSNQAKRLWENVGTFLYAIDTDSNLAIKTPQETYSIKYGMMADYSVIFAMWVLSNKWSVEYYTLLNQFFKIELKKYFPTFNENLIISIDNVLIKPNSSFKNIKEELTLLLENKFLGELQNSDFKSCYNSEEIVNIKKEILFFKTYKIYSNYLNFKNCLVQKISKCCYNYYYPDKEALMISLYATGDGGGTQGIFNEKDNMINFFSYNANLVKTNSTLLELEGFINYFEVAELGGLYELVETIKDWKSKSGKKFLLENSYTYGVPGWKHFNKIGSLWQINNNNVTIINKENELESCKLTDIAYKAYRGFKKFMDHDKDFGNFIKEYTDAVEDESTRKIIGYKMKDKSDELKKYCFFKKIELSYMHKPEIKNFIPNSKIEKSFRVPAQSKFSFHQHIFGCNVIGNTINLNGGNNSYAIKNIEKNGSRIEVNINSIEVEELDQNYYDLELPNNLDYNLTIKSKALPNHEYDEIGTIIAILEVDTIPKIAPLIIQDGFEEDLFILKKPLNLPSLKDLILYDFRHNINLKVTTNAGWVGKCKYGIEDKKCKIEGENPKVVSEQEIFTNDAVTIDNKSYTQTIEGQIPQDHYSDLRYSFLRGIYNQNENNFYLNIESYTSPILSNLDFKYVDQNNKVDSEKYKILKKFSKYGVKRNVKNVGEVPKLSFNPVLSGLRCFNILEDFIFHLIEDSKGLVSDGIISESSSNDFNNELIHLLIQHKVKITGIDDEQLTYPDYLKLLYFNNKFFDNKDRTDSSLINSNYSMLVNDFLSE